MSVGKYTNQRDSSWNCLRTWWVNFLFWSSRAPASAASRGLTSCPGTVQLAVFQVSISCNPKLLRPAVFALPSAAPRLPRCRFSLICASFGFIIGLSHTAEAAAAPGPACCYISTLQTLPAVNWRSVGVKRTTAGVHTHLVYFRSHDWLKCVSIMILS